MIEESRPILRRRPVLHVRVFEDGVQRASTLVLAQHVLHEVRLTPRDEQQRERVFASGPPSHADPLRFLRRFGRGARSAPRPSFSRRGTPVPSLPARQPGAPIRCVPIVPGDGGAGHRLATRYGQVRGPTQHGRRVAPLCAFCRVMAGAEIGAPTPSRSMARAVMVVALSA